MKAFHHSVLPLLILATGACATGEHLNGPASPQPSRAARSTFTVAPAPRDAEALAWESAGSAALRSHLVVQPGFDEVLSFPADAPVAASYRFNLHRGDKLDVKVTTELGQAPYADVFEVIDSEIFRHVYGGRPATAQFTYTATTDGEHVLRLQPPMKSAGRYRVHVAGAAVSGLEFPVAGVSPQSIAGQWGDARDGGARSHKGVDIFAPRGTPVVAVTDGVITSVESTPTGGRVVWQRDTQRGLMYYYAHLDEQLTTSGRTVHAGDTIGTVGNTGNASGGSTHLHFGIYRTGYEAENPTPYLLASAKISASTQLTADFTIPPQLGHRVNLPGDHVRLRASPSELSTVLAQLDIGTELLLLGSLNGWSRVVLPDGRTGFIAGYLLAGGRRAVGSQ